jgi:hypothetical protein
MMKRPPRPAAEPEHGMPFAASRSPIAGAFVTAPPSNHTLALERLISPQNMSAKTGLEIRTTNLYQGFMWKQGKIAKVRRVSAGMTVFLVCCLCFSQMYIHAISLPLFNSNSLRVCFVFVRARRAGCVASLC